MSILCLQLISAAPEVAREKTIDAGFGTSSETDIEKSPGYNT